MDTNAEHATGCIWRDFLMGFPHAQPVVSVQLWGHA